MRDARDGAEDGRAARYRNSSRLDDFNATGRHFLVTTPRRRHASRLTPVDAPTMDPDALDACLRRWAASTPDAVAVARVTDDERVDILTWRSLSRRARILARAVLDCPNGRALSACRDGIAAVVALHACALVGRSCVPVDVDAWPTARWTAAAKNVGATAAVCATERDAARVRAVFGEENIRVILVSDDVDADENEIADEDEDEFPRLSSSSTELYAAHTSGSTGAPKCAPTTHGRALMYARAKCRVERITRDSRVCLASNATFDPHAGDVCAAALVGAACVVASRAMIQRDFAAVLRLGRVTHVCCTPTVFSLARCPRGAKDAPTVRCVTLIGEKTSPETLRLWADDVELYNAYGATETTVVQTYARMRRDDDPRRAGKPYGEDLGFAWVDVAEDEDKDAPTTAIRFATARRVVGEIIIGGACASEGYLGGASTAAPSPFVRTSRGSAYRTGDRGYLDDAGDLFILGRVDRQVKIRGHRIELDEIELAARAERGLVDDVAVTLEADETLVAYHRATPTFSPRRDDALVVYALERALARTLPRVMIPRRHVFVARDAWPMTTSGKTNRRELSRLLASGAVETFRPERVEPRPGLERVVADAWAHALGARFDDVCAEDSFEALGGSSLNVVAASRALAEDARLSRPAADANRADDDEARGLGEAAALLPANDEPAACASFPGAFTDGPLAPCEILAKPTVREYAAFLAASGVTFTGARETDDDENDYYDLDDRYAMEACGRGVLAVARSLFDGGVRPRGRHLRAAAASLSDDADAVVRELIARGVDVSEPSPAGTLATHLAAARGRAMTLRALLAAGTPPGAKDADKQTILHLAARSGDVETVRVAADAVKHLQTRRGGLEAWDRWKRTAAAWALREGSGDALRALRDAGAKLSALEREASHKTHGELSAKSEVQWTHRPTRKREASAEVMEALSRALDGTRVEDDEEDARRAVSALRDLVCANAANRETSRALGIIPKLCARVRERHCVDAIGAIRNLAASAASAAEARESGALDALADVVRARAKTAATPLAGEDKRLVFAAASAIRAIAVKDTTSASIVSRNARDVARFVLAECDVDLFADVTESDSI